MNGPGANSTRGEGRYILEFIPIGGSVKVTAVDPHSGLEVSVVGAASAGERALGELAVRKLEFMLKKRAGKPPGGGTGSAGPGILA